MKDTTKMDDCTLESVDGSPPKYYPGNAATHLVQGPSLKSVNKSISILRKASKDMGMETFDILDKGKDPNGGYRAVIITHNWNPVTWVKEQWEKRDGGVTGRAQTARDQARINAAKKAAVTRERIKGETRLAAMKERQKYEAMIGNGEEIVIPATHRGTHYVVNARPKSRQTGASQSSIGTAR